MINIPIKSLDTDTLSKLEKLQLKIDQNLLSHKRQLKHSHLGTAKKR